MGQNKTLKKQRKYARQAMTAAFNEFKEGFNEGDFLKPCPKIIPRLIWNFLIWIVIKKK